MPLFPRNLPDPHWNNKQRPGIPFHTCHLGDFHPNNTLQIRCCVLEMAVCLGRALSRHQKDPNRHLKRPVIVVQRDSIDQNKFGKVLVVSLTKQTK
ncbi:hypothetical protein LCGC14_1607810, partial [marine sediment metagenome]